MARKIFIRTIQNKNRKNAKAYGKWYGKVVHIGRVNTEQLAEHIMEHGSVYTDDVVIGITRAARLTTDFSAFGIAEANSGSGSGSGSGNDDPNPGGSVVEDEP
jgi:hypothetical protein